MYSLYVKRNILKIFIILLKIRNKIKTKSYLKINYNKYGEEVIPLL